ncbi:hypothetical protein G4Y79_24190 [Phototrophicus methaneseepsis]|uniref:Uncharacterized protein n=1 Tax=Phototrophicus methaneseepsis TaxID=2710758 RepID=A0A7S8E9B2_9CHLR|nr:hypothetical protein [Phototrophicus methaneseepsis]QPC82746.1 hypothetical protein G4Y79_24190 [Phototrophicus methaneseepsis]
MSERPRPQPRTLGYSLPQNEPRLQCPYCGYHRFEWGTWTGGSYQAKNDEMTQPIRARKCLGCGHVALFAPVDGPEAGSK